MEEIDITPETKEPISKELSSEKEGMTIKKNYILKLDSIPYHFTIEFLLTNIISLMLRQSEKISYDYYSSQINYENIIKLLHLDKNIYKDISKIIELFDNLIKNEKIFIYKDTVKDKIELHIKLEQNSKEEEYCINLEKKILTEKKMMNIVIDEINEMKNNTNQKNNIKLVEQDEKSLEKELKNIDEEINRLSAKKREIQQKLNKSKNSIIKKKDYENAIIISIDINKNYIDENIYFLTSENLKSENVDIYIDGIKSNYTFNNEYDKYSSFQRENVGLYTIVLKFKTKIINCSNLFYNCKRITEIDLSYFNTEDVTSMKSMFSDCTNLKKLNLSSLDTHNVTDMSYMFHNCYNLQEVNFSSFNTHNVNNMEEMFINCESLQELDLSSFDTHNVTNMSKMFSKCYSLANLNLSSFNYDKVKYLGAIFDKCCSLKWIKINKDSKRIKELIDEQFINLEEN